MGCSCLKHGADQRDGRGKEELVFHIFETFFFVCFAGSQASLEAPNNIS